MLNAELRLEENDERFSNSCRTIVRYGCDNEADGFHFLRKSSKKNGWEKKMLELYRGEDPGKKDRSERLLRAYVYSLTHPERRDHHAPRTKGSPDKPVKVRGPEYLSTLKVVSELPITVEQFHKEATEAFKIFREVLNGDGVRGFSSAILDIMPEILKLRSDDKVRDNAPMLGVLFLRMSARAARPAS